MSENESSKVTVNVSKGIAQFLEDVIPSTEFESDKEYLEEAVVGRVQADIEGDMFNPKPKRLASQYFLTN